MISKLKQAGPGALIAAAFIGPGTVTACTLAGANYGYTLLWALLFATVATIILQEMSARLGVITGQGLGETLGNIFTQSVFKWPLFILIVTALYLGNAAYEAGNLSGASLGISAVTGESELGFKLAVLIIAALSAALIWFGSYKYIERVLITLVILMALAFVSTFIIVRPDAGALLSGLFTPRLPDGSLMTVIALIGTTIVPYNLFLHASSAKTKWNGEGDLAIARTDTVLSIGLGGLITILIAATAAASLFTANINISGVTDMAAQLEPAFGAASKYLLGIGFFAAGLSSSLTAPLATAYAVTEIMGKSGGNRTRAFRLIGLSVILIGASLALTGIKPITIILTAQFANGLLLPIIAMFLLYVMNQRSLLGKNANGWTGNSLGVGVVLVTAVLGIRLMFKAMGLL